MGVKMGLNNKILGNWQEILVNLVQIMNLVIFLCIYIPLIGFHSFIPTNTSAKCLLV